MLWNCVNNPGNFCYVCGETTFVAQKRTNNLVVRTAYFLYLEGNVGEQDKTWASHACCNFYSVRLREWLDGKKCSMQFAVPIVWREPTNPVNNCYFCMTPPQNMG
ncbi:uncharacterized protein TNCT_93071 [Trichonephila clavata]|uniref:Uncharacterized protein n=1 Tax=Trichonephila clavata TaxID=2740835 RepID=A0A8X6HFG6_TRICU|nr:uncharacterized protein TNCT_93071 [Trichonephila clavata]